MRLQYMGLQCCSVCLHLILASGAKLVCVASMASVYMHAAEMQEVTGWPDAELMEFSTLSMSLCMCLSFWTSILHICACLLTNTKSGGPIDPHRH